MFIKNHKQILLILLLGLLIRIYGINHGFPYIFHPDEPAVIRTALGIRFDINPKHFDWPHLYFYVNYFIFYSFAFLRDVIANLGYKEAVSLLFPLMWNDKLVFYLISRVLTALVGTATIVPVYLAAKKLFNRTTAMFAALTVAVIPLHVVYSHLALPDIPMLFFLCWYIYFASCIFKDPSSKNYVLAGLFLGLSASTKYNGGLAVIYILLINVFTQKFDFSSFKKILFTGVSSVLGFLIGTPFALFDFDTFIRTDGPQGALWQFTNVGGVSLAAHISAFFNYFSLEWASDLGYTVLYVFVLGLFFCAFTFLRRFYAVVISKGKVGDFFEKFQTGIGMKMMFLYIPALVFIYYISGFAKNRAHYYLIAYPFIILIFSYFCSRIYTAVSESRSLKSNLSRKLIILMIMFVLFFPLVFFSVEDVMKMVTRKTGPAVGGEIEEYIQEIR